MSEPAAKQRSPIDLDEFERRLRGTVPAPPPAPAQEDPLAELARLVGNADRFRAPTVRLPRPARPSLVAPAPQRFNPPQRIEEPPAAAFDFGTRGVPPESHEEYAAEEPPYEGDHFFEQNDIDEERQPRSRRSSLLMGGSLALVLAGIAVTFAMKAHAPAAGGDAPTIKAAAGPIKVQPTNQNHVDVADRNASLLDRSDGDRLASSKIVNNEEQPVDLQAIQLQRSAAAQSQAGAAPAAPTSTNGAGSYFPTPIRVRTVSVRADGSVIGDGGLVAPALPAAGAVPAPLMASNVPPPAQPLASTATPTVAAAPLRRPTTPKNATTPKTIPMAAKPADYKADAAPIPATDAPIVLRSAPTKPARLASVEPGDIARAAPVAALAGNYVVQLAALGSEAEAKSALDGFQKKFPAELRGRHTALQKADSNGHTVFRVRVVGLMSDDANVLCSKLKAGGDLCFVKRD